MNNNIINNKINKIQYEYLIKKINENHPASAAGDDGHKEQQQLGHLNEEQAEQEQSMALYNIENLKINHLIPNYVMQ